MNEPWFDANSYAWIPGTAGGVLGGLWGALAGCLAPSGKAKGLVLGLGWAFVIIGVGMLAVAVVAIICEQPYGVWYGLLLPGVIDTIVFPPLLIVVRMRYRQAELRKVAAMDIG